MPGNLSLCVSVSVCIWPALTLTSSEVWLAHRTGPESRKSNFDSFTSHAGLRLAAAPGESYMQVSILRVLNKQGVSSSNFQFRAFSPNDDATRYRGERKRIYNIEVVGRGEVEFENVNAHVC